jgi:pyruvate dehydrogenase (quinone)
MYTTEPSVRPSDDALHGLAEILNGARTTTILGGAGCAGAHDQLMDVAGKLQAPIVHAMRGEECIEDDNPFDVGMTGLLGFASGYYAMMNCETLLMLGTDFPYQQFYVEAATIVQVDRRGDQIGRRTKVDVGLVGDVQTTLAALSLRLTQKRDDRHLKASLQHYQTARQGLDDLASGESGRKPIHPQ